MDITRLPEVLLFTAICVLPYFLTYLENRNAK